MCLVANAIPSTTPLTALCWEVMHREAAAAIGTAWRSIFHAKTTTYLKAVYYASYTTRRSQRLCNHEMHARAWCGEGGSDQGQSGPISRWLTVGDKRRRNCNKASSRASSSTVRCALHPRPAAAADDSTLLRCTRSGWTEIWGRIYSGLVATAGDQSAVSDEMEDGRWLLLMRVSAGSFQDRMHTRASLQRDPVSSD